MTLRISASRHAVVGDRQRPKWWLDVPGRPARVAVVAVVGLLEVMIDPLGSSVANASVEDEDILPQTAAELDAAHASIARNEGISHEDILRQFGAKRR